MRKKLVLLLVALLTFSTFSEYVQGKISVGVKVGDWMEYDVTSTGAPPPEHDVRWAKLEVISVNAIQLRSIPQQKHAMELYLA